MWVVAKGMVEVGSEREMGAMWGEGYADAEADGL